MDTDETLLEALNRKAVEHERKHPKRPWKLYWGARAEHLQHLTGVYSTYSTRERAMAARAKLIGRVEADDEITLPMDYWVVFHA